jgi:hypothetical protein
MTAEQATDRGRKWGQIVARAWADESFRRRLLADPPAVLKEHGITLAPGVQVRVVEDTAALRHLTLPLRPDTDQFAEEDLSRVVGGMCADTVSKCQIPAPHGCSIPRPRA